jgi:hypothetical protein
MEMTLQILVLLVMMRAENVMEPKLINAILVEKHLILQQHNIFYKIVLVLKYVMMDSIKNQVIFLVFLVSGVQPVLLLLIIAHLVELETLKTNIYNLT